jgi:hypothetical protein
MAIRDNPLFTEVFDDPSRFAPPAGSIYLFRQTSEERTRHIETWRGGAAGVAFAEVTAEREHDVDIAVNGVVRAVRLRSASDFGDVLTSAGHPNVYIDVTGLSHRIWAPLLKNALRESRNVVVVYAEPQWYQFHRSPTEGEIFDLRLAIEGVKPLPGFAVLSEITDDNCFIPLVGFEGVRLAYIIEEVQPQSGKMVPIVGVPGFVAEFPFSTYHGNKVPLMETGAWRDVRYSRANCPFSVFFELEEIARRYPNDLIKVAPIGTKPHAVGAVLFALVSPRRVELVYDHPVAKPSRTVGLARVLAYHVSMFTR